MDSEFLSVGVSRLPCPGRSNSLTTNSRRGFRAILRLRNLPQSTLTDATSALLAVESTCPEDYLTNPTNALEKLGCPPYKNSILGGVLR